MKRPILIFLLFSSSMLMGQDDIVQQMQRVQELLPSATSVGILWNASSSPQLESQFATISGQTGLKVIHVPIKSMREIASSIRSLSDHKFDFVYMAEDRMITGKNTIKFVVKSTLKKNIPVFAPSENVHVAGAFGELVLEGSQWQIKINSKSASNFDIVIPSDNTNIVVAAK